MVQELNRTVCEMASSVEFLVRLLPIGYRLSTIGYLGFGCPLPVPSVSICVHLWLISAFRFPLFAFQFSVFAVVP